MLYMQIYDRITNHTNRPVYLTGTSSEGIYNITSLIELGFIIEMVFYIIHCEGLYIKARLIRVVKFLTKIGYLVTLYV